MNIQLPENQLLYSREQAAKLLGGVSVSTIIRLERAGKLQPIRLSGSPTAQVFFRAKDVLTLVEGAVNAPK
jgi:hypothetical protein